MPLALQTAILEAYADGRTHHLGLRPAASLMTVAARAASPPSPAVVS